MADRHSTAVQGPRLFSETHNGHLLEVFQDRGPDQHGYIGTCDGVPSVIATRPDLVLTGLKRKHIDGLPEGELVDFAAAREVLAQRGRRR